MPLPKGRKAVLSLLLPLDKAPQVTASLGRADDLALPSWGSNCFFQGLEMQGQAMWHRAQCRETVQGTAYSSPPTWRVHGFTYKKLHWKQGQRRMQGWVSSQPNCATQIKFKSIDICFYFRSLENIQRSLGIKKLQGSRQMLILGRMRCLPATISQQLHPQQIQKTKNLFVKLAGARRPFAILVLSLLPLGFFQLNAGKKH